MDPDCPFAPRSEEERQIAFAQSTLVLVLKQLGLTRDEIEGFRRSMDPALWDFEWFNSYGFVPFHIEAARVFSFDLAEAFFRPGKSRLIKAYRGLRAGVPSDIEFAMIFKVAGWGRMIAYTPGLAPDVTHIHVASADEGVDIAVFTDFLAPWRTR